MKLIPFNKEIHSGNHIAYIGELKGQKAFIIIAYNKIERIVLEDASHFYGESLYSINENDIMIYTEVAANTLDPKLQEKDQLIDQLYARIRDLEADIEAAERFAKISGSQLEEKEHRHQAQLRSFFYLLDQLEAVGTHHEKGVVIGYIRKCIAGFLKNDRLDAYTANDDLPF